MLLQTNSYVVPKERRSEHARLMRRFRQVLTGLGCEEFEVYEQVGPNWTGTDSSGRFVQLMRFRDRKQHAALQAAERSDPAAQQLIAEFCELVNFPYQQQQGFFAVGFYNSLLQPQLPRRSGEVEGEAGVEELQPVDAGLPVGEPAAPVEEPALAADTQAYAAEVEAESHEPGHLSDESVPMEPLGAEDPFADLAEITETPGEHPAPELIEQAPPAIVEEPPVQKGSLFSRRR